MLDLLKSRIQSLTSPLTWMADMLSKSLYIQKVAERHDLGSNVKYHGHHVMQGAKRLGSAVAVTEGRHLIRCTYHGLDEKTAETMSHLLASQYGEGAVEDSDLYDGMEKAQPGTDLSTVGRRQGRSGSRSRPLAVAESGAKTFIPSRAALKRLREATTEHLADLSYRAINPGRAICGTEGCGGRLEFHSFTDMRTGVPKTLEHCPSCKTTTPVVRRPATPTDSVSAARDEQTSHLWKLENTSQAKAG